MIAFQNISGKVVEVTLPRKVEPGGFPGLSPQVDRVIEREGSIRLILNLARFRGWTGWQAAKEHFLFVKAHHQKVERIAVITGPPWQKAMVGIAHLLVHRGVKLFDADQVEAARSWING